MLGQSGNKTSHVRLPCATERPVELILAQKRTRVPRDADEDKDKDAG